MTAQEATKRLENLKAVELGLSKDYVFRNLLYLAEQRRLDAEALSMAIESLMVVDRLRKDHLGGILMDAEAEVKACIDDDRR